MGSPVRVLVVSAHPDDETLGAGGTLLKHRAAGDELHWLIATTRYEPRWTAADVESRSNQVQCVAEAFGMTSARQLGHPDAALESVPRAALIEGVDAVVRAVGPEIVYVVHGGDVHSDHVLVNQATMAVLKSFRMGGAGVRRVLAYETLSSTDAAVQDAGTAFLPTVFSDITGYLDAKCRVMRLYGSELQEGWLPRTESAMTALARVRGASVGVEHAEAFALLREVV